MTYVFKEGRFRSEYKKLRHALYILSSRINMLNRRSKRTNEDRIALNNYQVRRILIRQRIKDITK